MCLIATVAGPWKGSSSESCLDGEEVGGKSKKVRDVQADVWLRMRQESWHRVLK